MLTYNEQKRAAKIFKDKWIDILDNKHNEVQLKDTFWIDLLTNVFGISDAVNYINFEKPIELDKMLSSITAGDKSYKGRIDAYIKSTKVLIEQKGPNVDLNKGVTQSDGQKLRPIDQAKRYAYSLGIDEMPSKIVVSNFKEFHVYDMRTPNAEPHIIKLENLDTEFTRLGFLTCVDNTHLEREMQISMAAGEIVGKIYDLLYTQYENPELMSSLHAINQLCVRIVFCLYAEDAGIFGSKSMFHDYLAQFEAKHIRRALIDLFTILNTPVEERDHYLNDDLAAFPYVNGGMFEDNQMEIPQFTDELRVLILDSASASFDWSQISPTIFGAVFESTLNPETRREGGMHYTSIENIHKVIDPLFLDALRLELNEINLIKQPAAQKRKALIFQEKLASLTFLDPACGSGNFLTETYISLRNLENEAISLIYGKQSMLSVMTDSIIKVSIQQMFGIELNDFAVSVAKTALWIAESQLMEKTKEIIYSNDTYLPLKAYNNIVEGDALKLDWNTIISNKDLTYIIGNPPFRGRSKQSQEQKNSSEYVFGANFKYGQLDFVASWFVKAAKYVFNTDIQVSFVATNSIVQGEQVSTLWTEMNKYNAEIIYAYQPFKWDSESSKKAAVTVVIIGFQCKSSKSIQKKYLYSDKQTYQEVKNINAYLLNAPNILMRRVAKPLSGQAKILYGSKPNDGGNFILTSDEKEELLKQYPEVDPLIKEFIGGKELLKGTKRYVIWLKDADPNLYLNCPPILNRIDAVKSYRLSKAKNKTSNANSIIEKPTLFASIASIKGSHYIAIPEYSSESRKYIPMLYLDKDVIASNKLYMVDDGSLYEFGVLESNVHMAWMKTFGGKLESRYAYSSGFVYNTFPWPKPTELQKTKIEQTAKEILNIRAKYKCISLGDLYSPKKMQALYDLTKAHQDNDKAVMEAYGMDLSIIKTESQAVEFLIPLYEKLLSDNMEKSNK